MGLVRIGRRETASVDMERRKEQAVPKAESKNLYHIRQGGKGCTPRQKTKGCTQGRKEKVVPTAGWVKSVSKQEVNVAPRVGRNRLCPEKKGKVCTQGRKENAVYPRQERKWLYPRQEGNMLYSTKGTRKRLHPSQERTWL